MIITAKNIVKFILRFEVKIYIQNTKVYYLIIFEIYLKNEI
ncbi:hypothetical protein J541_2329 [Acinetobacter pittii]|nr:hypothetical protein J551_2874 [Acinetobacter sp. 1475718]EXR99725.1 hypothetical protein J687_2374 [Acinetobacter sp. 225588]KCX61755.1 hypothetical protein J541_2329 [Acinetobacter pittii]